MKRSFLLAGLVTILLACNNNPNNNAANADSSNHAADNQISSHATNQSTANPITQTMDKMMHEMHGATPTGNNDIDFAAMMLEHHKAAVEMSRVEVVRGNSAQKIIDDQNKEI
jgi:uncharacterized protein (DUF305 family)